MSNPCSPDRRPGTLALALLAAAVLTPAAALSAAATGQRAEGPAGAPASAPAARARATTSAITRTVHPFDASTWRALSGEVERATAVVFTATYCANCPEAVARLVQAVRTRGLDAQVLAVVIDGTPGDSRLATHPHYRGADRVYAFSASVQQVQYAVNPRWRGITPSVALISPGAPPQWVTGVPDDVALGRWGR